MAHKIPMGTEEKAAHYCSNPLQEHSSLHNNTVHAYKYVATSANNRTENIK